MKLLANKVRIQGMKMLLADIVHKQEPQRFTQPSLNTYVSSSSMAFTACYLCRDGCVKCSSNIFYVMSLQDPCSCTLSDSDTVKKLKLIYIIIR